MMSSRAFLGAVTLLAATKAFAAIYPALPRASQIDKLLAGELPSHSSRVRLKGSQPGTRR